MKKTTLRNRGLALLLVLIIAVGFAVPAFAEVFSTGDGSSAAASVQSESAGALDVTSDEGTVQPPLTLPDNDEDSVQPLAAPPAIQQSIIGFMLDETVSRQQLPVGAPNGSATFPESIVAILEDGASHTFEGVTWALPSDTAFDSGAPATYTYTAVLGGIEAFVLKEGVALPVIQVSVVVPAPQGAPPLPVKHTSGEIKIIEMALKIDGILAGSAPVSITKDTIIRMDFTFTMGNYATTAITAGDYTVFATTIPANLYISDLSNLKISIDTGSSMTNAQGDPYQIGVLSFSRSAETDPWKIKLTYDAEINGLAQVAGTFFLESEIQYEKYLVPGITVHFDIGSGIDIELEFPNRSASSLTKKFEGWYLKSGAKATTKNDEYKANTAKWIIDVNYTPPEGATPGKATGVGVRAEITDTIGVSNGGTDTHWFGSFNNIPDNSSVKVWQINVATGDTIGAELQRTNIQSEADADASKYYWKDDTSHVKRLIDLGTINKAYRIEVMSNFDSLGHHANDMEWVSVSNEAKMGGLIATASAEMSSPKWINKVGVNTVSVNVTGGFPNEQKHYMEWVIYVNRTSQDLSDAEVIDRINSSGHLWPADLPANKLFDVATSGDTSGVRLPAYIVQEISYGNDVNGEINFNDATLGTDVTASFASGFTLQTNNNATTKEFNAQELKITMGNITRPYKITLRTQVKDPAFSKTTKLGNMVEMIYNNRRVTSYTDKFWHTANDATKGTFEKYGGTNATLTPTVPIDVGDKAMTWVLSGFTGNIETTKITLADWYILPNGKRGETGSLTDYSMTLDPSSLKVYLGTYDSPGTKLTRGNAPGAGDYTIKDNGAPGYMDGFDVEITKPITGAFHVVYHTTYTLPELDATLGLHKGGIFENATSAKYFYTAGDHYLYGSDMQEVPEINLANVQKTGEISADNKVASWTIDFNANRASMSAAVPLNDTFSEGMVFKGSSSNDLQVYKIENNGAETLQPNNGSVYTWESNIVGSTTGFKLKINNINAAWYRIRYKTDLTDNATTPLRASYTNKAWFTVTTAPGVQKAITAEATVKPHNNETGGILAKGGSFDPITHKYTWTVSISPNVAVNNAIFTDTLSAGLLLDAATIAVKSGGALLIKDTHYTLTVYPRNPADFTTTFKVDFKDKGHPLPTSKLEVTYQSQLDMDTIQIDPLVPTKATVNNSARLVGDNVESWAEVVNTSSFTIGGSSGFGKPVELEIEKRDADTNALIDGAIFEIWANNSLVMDNISTFNGKTTGIKLLAGSYTVKEKSAPTGYTLDVTSERNVTLTSSKIVVTFHNKIIYVPPQYTLSVRKTDADTGASLAGAEFRVLDQSNNLKGTITVGANGLGSLATKLDAGTYVLVETKAPTGYSLPANPRTTVVVSASNAVAFVVTVPITNEKTPSSSSVPPAPSVPPASSTPPPILPTPPTSSSSSEVVIPPVVPTTPTPPPASQTEILAGENDVQINSELTIANVPLGNFTHGAAWSLLNLIMSLLALSATVLLFISMMKRENRDEAQQKRFLLLRISAMLTGLIPGILFIILEDIRLPMIWVNRWTPIIGAFFIINMIFVCLHLNIKRNNEKNKDILYED